MLTGTKPGDAQPEKATPETAKPEKKTGEKVRGMNATLTTEAGLSGGLHERDPHRLHVTRRQVAFALILAVLGVVAAVLTVDSVSSSASDYTAVVTTSKVYDLNFATAGTISTVTVKVGDQVKAGQTLASEDTSALESQVAAAEGVVKADQQVLAEALAPQVTPAQRQQDELQLSQATTALQNAQNSLTAAENTGTAQVAAAQAQVTAAQALAAGDQSRYQQACPKGPVPPPAGLTGANAQAAEVAYTHCQTLQLQLDTDNAAVTQAQAGVPSAQAQAQAAINSAQSTVNSAQAAVNLAKYQLTLQGSETNPAAVAQAQANLSAAQGQLTAAQNALANAKIVAPDSGTIAAVYGTTGESVSPDGVHQYSAPAGLAGNGSTSYQLFPSTNTPGGSASNPTFEPVFELLAGTQQVTAYVPESAVSTLPVGHAATVSIPDLHATATGTVSSVSLQPSRSGSSVTYQVTVTLDRAVPGLLPGMSATVRG